jgi:hypothetical protein
MIPKEIENLWWMHVKASASAAITTEPGMNILSRPKWRKMRAPEIKSIPRLSHHPRPREKAKRGGIIIKVCLRLPSHPYLLRFAFLYEPTNRVPTINLLNGF